MKTLEKIVAILFVVALIGAITTILSVTSTVITDGEPYNGKVSVVLRNGSFFNSKSEILNNVLVPPRFFMSVDEYDEHYNGWHLMLGLIPISLLLLGRFETKKLSLKVVYFVYVGYWSFVTLYMYGNFLTGTFMTRYIEHTF